jgi:hypothetical protein
MVSTLAQIMAGVETRLATISGLRTSDVSPTQVVPPCAFVTVPSIPEYRITMGRGRYRLALSVVVLVSTGGPDRLAQLKLSSYADVTGATSIPLAIEADKTLGGAVDNCIVEDFRPLGTEEVGVIGYYGGIFGLQVVASGA